MGHVGSTAIEGVDSHYVLDYKNEKRGEILDVDMANNIDDRIA